jgi:hypothetical protein
VDQEPVVQPEEEEGPLCLSLVQRLADWESKKTCFDRRPIQGPATKLPKDVWGIILEYLVELEDVLAFGDVCSAFFMLVQQSRVWPNLLDSRFGAGRSQTLAESKVTLDAMWGHRKALNEDIDFARKTFYRKAKFEFQKLYVIELLQRKGWVKDLEGSMFWGCAVLHLEKTANFNGGDFCVLVTSPGHVSDTNSDSWYDSNQELYVNLCAEMMYWRRIPIIPWECFKGQHNVASLICRLYNGRGDNIVLGATKSS